MRNLLLAISFCFACTVAYVPIYAQTGSPANIRKEWKALRDKTYEGSADPHEVARTGAELKQFVTSQMDDAKAADAQIAEELIDFTTALAYAHAGDLNQAYANLLTEVANQSATGRVFLQNTRNPEGFALDVFALHSAIMAHEGKTLPIDGSGYEVFAINQDQGGPFYVFVHSPAGADEGGVSIEMKDETDERRVVSLFGADANGEYGLVDRAQVVVDGRTADVGILRNGNGQNLIVFSDVTGVIDYIGEFKIPLLHQVDVPQLKLRIDEAGIEDPLTAATKPESATRSDSEPAATTSTRDPNPPPGEGRFGKKGFWLGISLVAVLLGWALRAATASGRGKKK